MEVPVSQRKLRKGMIYSNAEAAAMVGGKLQGGIRYGGKFPNIRSVGIFITDTRDAIYRDTRKPELVTYVGEGQVGDQKMEKGNRVLVWCYFNEMAIQVFLRTGKNRFKFLGVHIVRRIKARPDMDRENRVRGAFVFELEPIDRHQP